MLDEGIDSVDPCLAGDGFRVGVAFGACVAVQREAPRLDGLDGDPAYEGQLREQLLRFGNAQLHVLAALFVAIAIPCEDHSVAARVFPSPPNNTFMAGSLRRAALRRCRWRS